MIHTFGAMDIETKIAISALHGENIAELMEMVCENLKETPPINPLTITATFCIVGVPNVGKSSLLNALIQEQRAATSNVAGTTRDSIEDLLTYKDKNYLVIDTAGIVKKNAQKKVVEKFSHIRMEKSIEKADICLFVVDATKEITTREKGLISDMEKKQKSCLILLNKWDLMKSTRQEHVLSYLKQVHPFLKEIPIICISAQTKKGLEKILPNLERILEEKNQKITTSKINQTLQKALLNHNPPAIQGKRLRIYYATQTSTNPPTFLLFVNYKNLLTNTYIRYLKQQFRKAFGFYGSPIIFNLRKKASSRVHDQSQVSRGSRISSRGFGKSNAFGFITTIESLLATTMLFSFLIIPSIRIIFAVCPNPTSSFTSKTMPRGSFSSLLSLF